MAAVEVSLPRIGKTSNVTSFSVQEDATPLDPGSSAGGVGTITVGVLEEGPDYPLMVGGVVLADGARGKTSGVVRSTSGNDGSVTVVADSVLSLFNTDRTIPPYVGTLSGAINAYCDLVGISNSVVVDPSIASRPVVYPGGYGNVWVRVKQMLSAEQVEMALVFNNIHVRPLRLLEADMSRATTSGWSVSGETAARSVEVNWYDTRTGSQLEVYPVPGEEPQIIVVDAAETQVIEQTLSASLWTVNQPVMSAFVNNQSYEGTSGVYSVVGSDDLPIQPAQWTAAGGHLGVELTEDNRTIKITVRGADIPHLSPFRIAMSSGASNYYNSLHITGQGVAWETHTVTIPTGAPSSTTSTETGVTVENPYICSLAQAYNAGVHTARAYSGLQYTVSGSAFALNRSSGNERDLIRATVEDFDDAYGVGFTIADFDDEWSGQTFADFDAYWVEQFEFLWENQLFGNAPGARILDTYANFRITNTTTTESSVQYTAELDTTVADFDAAWAGGGTVADFDAVFPYYTCQEFSIVPLRRHL